MEIGAATAGLFYENNGKNYGITVAHLADIVDVYGNIQRLGDVGDSISAFDSDEPDENGIYNRVEIGKIVSIDRDTDSMIFEVLPRFKISPLVVTIGSGGAGRYVTLPRDTISIPVDKSKLNSTPYTDVCSYGAQRRGAMGRVVSQVNAGQLNDESKNIILEEDLCIQSIDDRNVLGRKALTDDGDCGMLNVDENVKVWSMHHAIGYSARTREYTSYSVPFHKILEARSHRDFLPHQDSVCRQSTPIARRRSSEEENRKPYDIGEVLRRPLTFDTRIVDSKEFEPELIRFPGTLKVMGYASDKFNGGLKDPKVGHSGHQRIEACPPLKTLLVNGK